MSQEFPYNAIVRYRCDDGEHESILLTVNAASDRQARKLAREEAQGILEEGIAFRITDVERADQQWAGPHCVFTLREMAELGVQLTRGADPRADTKAINAYLDRVGRWDDLRAVDVHPHAHGSELGIIVLWNEQVYNTL